MTDSTLDISKLWFSFRGRIGRIWSSEGGGSFPVAQFVLTPRHPNDIPPQGPRVLHRAVAEALKDYFRCKGDYSPTVLQEACKTGAMAILYLHVQDHPVNGSAWVLFDQTQATAHAPRPHQLTHGTRGTSESHKFTNVNADADQDQTKQAHISRTRSHGRL